MRRPCVGQRLLVEAVELVAMAMALVDDFLAVEPEGERVGREPAGVAAEPHRAAHVVDAEQVAQLVDDLVRRVLGDLGRVGVGRGPRRCARTRRPPTGIRSRCRSRESARVRAYSAAAIMPRLPRSPKPGRDEDADRVLEQLHAVGLLERFGLDVLQLDLQPVLEAAVVERLVDALVRVLVLDVLADEVDRDLVLRVAGCARPGRASRPSALRSAAGAGAAAGCGRGPRRRGSAALRRCSTRRAP